MSTNTDRLVSTLASQLSKPFISSLGLGLVSSAYFFHANLGATFFGIVPLIHQETLPSSTGGGGGGKKAKAIEEARSRPQTSLKLWSWFYDRAAPHMATSSLVASLSYLYSAYNLPVPSTSTSSNRPPIDLKPLLILASLSMATIAPYTILFMKPLNDDIKIQAKLKPPSPITDSSTGQIKGEELNAWLEQEANRKIKSWSRLHRVRLVLGSIGFSIGTVCLLLV
ncbi:hypothetical protein IE53DRAFT_383463 [Violaceomyces palustris]|uniref:Uncharacterized protein n=1 Tax=Violaceomyces palustris TaxID=1673888 RepID=A0ACD0P7F7_9BASI|nr:hypothetical protein IE53DRAFT_383463 [Violaceomyces palustris]